MSNLKNPMRFSMQNHTVDVGNWLDHENDVDDVQRHVTDVDIRPAEGNICVHWEVDN